jgi:hypothetical protein
VGRQRGRQHLGEAAWRELLQRFEQGDETQEAFCQREGVSKSTFTRWRSRGGAPANEAISFMPVASKKSTKSQAGFVDLGALCRPEAAAAGRLELTLDLGSGITLRVVRE